LSHVAALKGFLTTIPLVDSSAHFENLSNLDTCIKAQYEQEFLDKKPEEIYYKKPE